MSIPALLLFLASHSGKPVEKVPEYDLLPVCIDQVVIDHERFHCVVDNPDNPKITICDNGSMTLVFKKGMHVKTCVEVHMVVPKRKLIK